MNSAQIRGLNGLRAIAVLLVLARHNFHLYSNSNYNAIMLPEWPLNWNTFFLNGWLGVDLFFVLSGFLIARPFLATNKPFPKLHSYAFKRALRIVPAYYFVLLATVFGLFPYYEIDQTNIGWRVIYHVIFLQDYLNPNINPVFWSLGVEEKFYFLVPLIFLLLHYAKNRYLKLSILLLPILAAPLLRYASFVLADSPDSYALFFRAARAPSHTALEPLFFGILIAWIESNTNRVILPRVVFIASSIGLLLILGSHEMMKTISLYDVVIQPFMIAICMAGLVYGTVFGVRLKLLENKVMDYFSRISYSLYLIHWALFPVVFLYTMAIADILILGEFATFAFFTFSYLALCVAAASLQYLYIEKPFLRIKSRI